MEKCVTKIPLEEEETKAFHEWLQIQNIPHTHIPNEIGGSTRAMKARAIKMKKMGTSKGFPDLLVFIPVYNINGHADCYQMCAIEMKRKKGSTTSKEQKEWLKVLQASGAMSAVCKGAEEAIAFVNAIRKEINE